MSRMSIHGSEYPIRKIFCDDFVFTIPLFQRAYSWSTEQAEEMLQDLLRAMEGPEETIDDLEPYFLGSIVLIKREEPDAQVIDGQQRLTTLTILLAALRSLIKSDYAEALTTYLCEKANIVTGTPERYRLTLRKQDANFFKTYVQEEGGIEHLFDLREVATESQRNIRENTLCILNELKKLPEGELMRLTQFVINRCFMIVVAVDTVDLDSAYRIFSVLNNRGLELAYHDILKAEFINAIPEELQDEYANKWERIANDLGSEQFEELFYDLRTIHARVRMRKGLIEEFHKYVYHPGHAASMTPQRYIDEKLIPYASARNSILHANYRHPRYTEKETRAINNMFKFLNNLDFNRWIPVVLEYFFQHWKEPEKVLRFLQDLERLVAYFVLCRVPFFRREERYYDILRCIHKREDPLMSPSSPLQLSPRERRDVLKRLDSDLYILNRHMCRYILLRLDTYLSEGSATYQHETVSVEHVLPQHPGADSEWRRTFPTREVHARYVNRLGNLALLSRNKNSQADNFDFAYKVKHYFGKEGGMSPFVITNQLFHYKEWTPEAIERRQRELINTVQQIWRL